MGGIFAISDPQTVQQEITGEFGGQPPCTPQQCPCDPLNGKTSGSAHGHRDHRTCAHTCMQVESMSDSLADKQAAHAHVEQQTTAP